MKHLRLLIGILVSAGLLLTLAGSPASAMDPPGLDRAIEAQEAHNPQLLANPNVVGTAVGLTAGGVPTVTIFTTRVGVAGLPASLDGVPVAVQVTGKLYALHHACGHTGGPPGSKPFPCDEPPPPPEEGGSVDPKARFTRPVPIGVSTGNEGECSAGTIGARVVTGGGNVFALSNNHVYALENNATIPSDVLQPGRFDTNCSIDSKDIIGELTSMNDFVGIDFSTNASNTIDAAIAETMTVQLGNATPSDGYGIPKSTTVTAAVGQSVQKYGRTTSLTKGEITGINATLNVGYSSGPAQFVHQIVVQSKKPFLKSGDSGALLVTDDSNLNPVGLLFAANRSGKFAVANEIDRVLDAFSVTIDGN